MLKYIFIKFGFIILLFIPCNIQSQEIRHLSVEEGLNNGYITYIEKDSLGFIWIGTSNGINRYSGYDFKHYNIFNYTFKNDNHVAQIINKDGELYVLGRDGVLLKYRYEFDDFEKIIHLPDLEFFSCSFLTDSQIIIGLPTGMIIVNTNERSVSNIMHPDLSFVRKIVYKDGKIYSSSSNGLVIFEYSNKKLKNLDTLFVSKDINHFAIDKMNRIWAATEKNGLLLYDGKSTEQVALSDDKSKSYTLRFVTFNNQQEAIVAVDGMGLYIIDHALRIRKKIVHDPDVNNSIRQNRIHHIYIDKGNMYWLAVGEVGIDLFKEENNPFLNISHVQNEKNSLHSNIVRSIFEDNEGLLWFGTENGLSSLTPGGVWTNHNNSFGLEGIPVLSINQYLNNIILGTYGEGLLEIDKAKNRVSYFFEESQNSVELIFATYSSKNKLWVGGNRSPLSVYINKTLTERFSISEVRSIVEGNGKIYVGGLNGLVEINPRNNSVRHYIDPITNIPEYSNVFAVHFDSTRSCLWLGNGNEFYKQSLTKGYKKERFIPSGGLELGVIYSIQADNSDILWISTSKGLYSFNPDTFFFRNYSDEDGVKIKEFGFGASAKLQNGAFAFGGPNGAVIFNPELLPKGSSVSDIFVSEFLINGVEPDSATVAFNINFLDDIELEYTQNSLLFRFEVLDFYGSKHNTFIWQLDGYDEYPVVSSDNRTAVYSKLEPGEYNLSVKVINSDGIEGKQLYQLGITIKQPFYSTYWAYCVYVLLAGILIYLIILYIRASEKKRFSDEKIKFFINVAHDIRTPVSLIQLLVEQIKHGYIESQQIELINRNVKNLNNYVTQLLEFQKAERQKLNISVRKVGLKPMLEEIALDFQPLLEKKSMDLTIDVSEVDVWIDEMKMSRVFNNLISNAIKYSEEGGQIKLKSRINEETIEVKVIDNGIGVPEKEQKLIFNRFSRASNVKDTGVGIGLMLVKHIVELHKGRIYFNSSKDIGSTFTVSILRGTHHFSDNQFEEIEAQVDSNNYIDKAFSCDKLILLVDDNDDLRQTIRNDLEKHYRIIEASNGKDGLVLALEKNPDVIITDVMMPVLSGKEFCKIIKSNFKTSHIPIIMITALADIQHRIEGIKVGADAYIEKPFSIEVLKVTINNLLRTRQMLGLVKDRDTYGKKVKQSPDEEFLSKVVDITKENLTDHDFSIDALCDKLGFSRSNLFRKLKGLTGMTPSDLIIKIKLNHAEELLRSQKDIRIADIAYESGFHDPKYFSTLFKKHYGKSPKDFIGNNEGL
ncbi:MAG: response regulator [Bacteroidales bacterium]|nr:response regulator [Bacteroidales bacterium]MCF8405361.1 response regulator [Bacteroidales bacterium]